MVQYARSTCIGRFEMNEQCMPFVPVRLQMGLLHCISAYGFADLVSAVGGYGGEWIKVEGIWKQQSQLTVWVLDPVVRAGRAA